MLCAGGVLAAAASATLGQGSVSDRPLRALGPPESRGLAGAQGATGAQGVQGQRGANGAPGQPGIDDFNDLEGMQCTRNSEQGTIDLVFGPGAWHARAAF